MVEFENDTEKEIYGFFKKNSDWQTVQSVANGLGLTWATVSKYVLHMEGQGILEKRILDSIRLYKIKAVKDG